MSILSNLLFYLVGDCQAIIDGKLYENGKPYEEKIARKRVELIEQGLSSAEARKQIIAGQRCPLRLQEDDEGDNVAER